MKLSTTRDVNESTKLKKKMRPLGLDLDRRAVK